MASVFPTSSSFTYDVWCYPSSVSNMCVLREFGQNTISGGYHDAVIGFRDGFIRTGVYNGTTGGYLSSNSGYIANTWYNIILVYNGTTHYLYVNGVLQNSVNVTRNIPTNFYLSIGLQDDFGYLGGVSNYFGGNIGAVKVYNTSFNKSQVIQNYNALAKRYTQVEPLLVTARQWFDASGNYRVTTVSNRVSLWLDNISSGTINAFQSTNASRPYYGSPTTNIISNGLHMIDFKDSGTNSILVTNATLTTTTALTICCAIYYSGSNSTFSTIFSTDGTFTTGSIQLFITSTNALQITVCGGALQASGNIHDWLPGYTFSANNAYVIVLNITPGTLTARVNGTSFSNTSITNNIAIRTSLWDFGNWSGDLTRYFSGGIGEFVYFNTSLTLTNMQMIEGYLGWKWGVSKSFASSHPHFYFPPVSNYSQLTEIKTFSTVGTTSWTVPAGVTSVRVLVIAGGGGGGFDGGGGGGAGGVINNASFGVTPGANLTVTVGGGGGSCTSVANNGGPGGNSVFGSLTAVGGGGGGSNHSTNQTGVNGGSGGGKGAPDAVGSGPGTGTAGQGNNGGGSNVNNCGGGGGGFSGVGGTGTTSGPGAGANGIQSDITGTSIWYAGGGGGGSWGTAFSGAGGQGGGGAGGTSSSYNGGNATFYGGGGGGSGSAGLGSSSGTGFQGVVIIAF